MLQNLTFSSYGPNNLDREIQSIWRHTPDGQYHQPTTDGNVITFRLGETEPYRSYIKLRRPVSVLRAS